jgi:hypothetical protein
MPSSTGHRAVDEAHTPRVLVPPSVGGRWRAGAVMSPTVLHERNDTTGNPDDDAAPGCVASMFHRRRAGLPASRASALVC